MTKPCKYGHPVNNTRKDGRCTYCNTERNRRYRKTDKGRATDLRYESRRKGTRTEEYQNYNAKPTTWYRKVKWTLLNRITRKQSQIKELEGLAHV